MPAKLPMRFMVPATEEAANFPPLGLEFAFRLARRGDRLWVIGYSLLFLAPALILLGVGLLVVGLIWLGLWLVYLGFTVRFFPRVRTPGK